MEVLSVRFVIDWLAAYAVGNTFSAFCFQRFSGALSGAAMAVAGLLGRSLYPAMIAQAMIETLPPEPFSEARALN